MNLLWFFLPVILALGAITSYEDIKTGKIRNKWIITAIIISITIHIFLYTSQIINLSYIIKISLFILFSFIIGFLMYLMGLWSPGDAKLFTAFVSLVPLTSYNLVTTSFWPLSVLVNTFVPVFLFLIIAMLIKSTWKQKFIALKNILHPKRVGQYLLVIFSIGWIIQLIFNYFNIQTNFLLNIIAIMGLITFLRKLYPYELNYLLFFVSILRIFINKDYILTFSFWKIFLIMALTYMIIMMFIREMSQIFTTNANINFLKRGMIPVEGIIKKGKEYFKIIFEGPSIFKEEDKNLIYQPTNDGLNKEDIKNIQKLHRTGHLHFNHLRVQQTIPFAIFMFFGALITLLIKGNFIVWLRIILG